jgi:anti-sigma B factor antagonist
MSVRIVSIGSAAEIVKPRLLRRGDSLLTREVDMQLEDRKEGNVVIIKVLDKRLDAQAANGFKDKLSGYISSGSRLIVLNMSEVDFVDSSGLGAMVSVLKSLGEKGRLAICGITDPVMRLFKLTRMNKVFSIFEEESEAIRALSK